MFFQKINTIYSYAKIESGGLLTKSTAQNTNIKQIEPPEAVRTVMISFILWQTYRFGNTRQHTFTAAVFTAQKSGSPFRGAPAQRKTIITKNIDFIQAQKGNKFWKNSGKTHLKEQGGEDKRSAMTMKQSGNRTGNAVCRFSYSSCPECRGPLP